MKFINKFFMPLMLESTLVLQKSPSSVTTKSAYKILNNYNSPSSESEHLDRNCKKLICAIIYQAYMDLIRYYEGEIDEEMEQFGNPASFFFDDLNHDGSYKLYYFSYYCWLIDRENDIAKVKAHLVKYKIKSIIDHDSSNKKNTKKRYRACKARYSNW